jgi:hypothetical protein
MINTSPSPGIAPEDVAPISLAPWLTARRLTFFVIGWLSVFALGSLFLANPFQAEPNAGATPDYFRVMYMHGLLIGMVGLLALLTLSVMKVRSLHVRVLITGGVLFATVLSALGGVFDTKIPGAEVAMWTQILSFFALDEILLVLAWGLFQEWRSGAPATRTLTYAAAAIASISMLFAAVMGHVAGWIMEFGENTPSLVANFRSFAGFDSQDSFVGALVGSHSHEMAVAAVGLSALVSIQFLGYATVTGTAKWIARVGVAMIGAGIVVVSAIYIAGVISQYAPPNFFNDNVPGDDLVSGVLVMGGGIVALLAVANLRTIFELPLRFATVWTFILSVATVAAAGYAVEMNEGFFGAGDPKAAGAAGDAIFTWFHQDVGLFLLPTIVLVMLVVQLLVGTRQAGWIGWFATVGATALFAGGMLWVFVDSNLYGPGYWLSTLGLIVVGAAILGTLYNGMVGHEKMPAAPTIAPRLPLPTS